jgi:hypothetical protein
MTVSVGPSVVAALTATVLVFGPAHADPPPLWDCGSRSGRDVTFSKGGKRDKDGNIIPRAHDAPRSPFPRGGAYAYGGFAANLKSSSIDVWRLGPFDVVCHAVVLDGTPLHPDRLRFARAVVEFEGSGGVIWHDETAIVLRGIPIAWWRRGASRQVHGTARDDTLIGTDGDDVIVPGSGNDLVMPGGGNDAVVFTSGTLVIADDPQNSGADHVELTRFGMANVAFTQSGTDLIISTPDGFIRIVNQLATAQGQVERIRLGENGRDVWVDAAMMRNLVEGR